MDNDMPEETSPRMASSYEEMALRKSRQADAETDPEKKRRLRDQSVELMRVANHYASAYTLGTGYGYRG